MCFTQFKFIAFETDITINYEILVEIIVLTIKALLSGQHHYGFQLLSYFAGLPNHCLIVSPHYQFRITYQIFPNESKIIQNVNVTLII